MSIGRYILGVLLAFFVGGAVIFALIGKPTAPATTFSSITGEKIALGDLRGKVVLVNFWATNCAICVKEMPGLVDIHTQYKNKGLEIIAVAMPYDTPDYVLKYAEDKKLPFAVALDVKGEAVRAFGNVSATPTSFLIGKDGRVLEKKTGELDFGELKSALDRHLGR